VPLSDYAANLEAMVAAMKAARVQRILVITPPPVYDQGRIKHQQEVGGARGGGGCVCKRQEQVHTVLLLVPCAPRDQFQPQATSPAHPTPTHPQQRMSTTDYVEPDRTNDYAAQYAAAARRVAAAHGLPVLDIHAGLQREPGWQTELLADGLHFTPAGSALVGRMLIDRVTEAYPDLE
jgi:lysophospholipase L1-like esterase